MNWTVIGCAALLIGSALQASSQSTATNGTEANQPANAWLRTPTPYPPAADNAPQAARAARDQYFDAVFGARSALTPTTASWAHIAHDVSSPDIAKVPEIPEIPDRAVLSGTFASFQSLLSQSQRSIYTEVLFSVDHVFTAPAGQLAPGGTITIIIPGGSVQTSDATLSYLVDPEHFFIQPQRRYLLVLLYHSQGDFYTLAKDWELADGVVKPNSKLEQMRAAKGKAILAGISETQLSTTIQRLLSPAQ